MTTRTPSPRVARATRLRTDDGVTAVEYALMIGLVAVVIVVAVALLGSRLKGGFTSAAGGLVGQSSAPGGGGGGGASAPSVTGFSKSNCNGGGNQCDVTMNWTAVTGATGYSWEYVDNNSSFTCNAGAFGAEESGSTGPGVLTAVANNEYNGGDFACFRVKANGAGSGAWAYSTTQRL